MPVVSGVPLGSTRSKLTVCDAPSGAGQSQRTLGQPEGTYGVEEFYVRVSTLLNWIEESIGP